MTAHEFWDLYFPGMILGAVLVALAWVLVWLRGKFKRR